MNLIKTIVQFLTISLLILFSSTCVFAQNLTPDFNLKLFKNSYEEAKTQFLESAHQLSKIKGLEVIHKSYPSPFDSHLTTDAIWIKTKPNNTSLQVFISGIHGIEGFTGSAVQSWLLQQKITPNSNSDYLLIHALNPYGFKNYRRVNEANVDLNRNFAVDEKTFKTVNSSYAEINSFLNPSVKVHLNFLSRFKFIFSAGELILRYSLESLRKAILSGQYEFPNGIYYGGSTPQYQTQIIDDVYRKFIQHYLKVFVVDLHTGYGQKNKLHLLANSQKEPRAVILNQIFSKDRIDYGDKKHFYSVTGDLLTYLGAQSKTQNQITGVAFEFGTLDSQTTLGSIESLRRMILENQKYHFTAENTKTEQEVDHLFKELFYPQNDDFKKNVLSQTAIEILKIDNYLKN